MQLLRSNTARSGNPRGPVGTTVSARRPARLWSSRRVPLDPPTGAGHPSRLFVRIASVGAPPAPLGTDAPPASQPRQAQGSDKYDWLKAWYPITTLESLQPGRPNAVQVMGLNLVVWRGPDGVWSVFEDACPHRLAPLSEGRIHDDGTLIYHGWTFDGSGACKSIPQIADPKAHATACSSTRACVKRYPSQELAGLLWVWPEAGPAAAADAAAAPPSCVPPQVLDGAWVQRQTWYMRDVPVGYDHLVDNLTDPSHVQFSHHGVIGNRNSLAHAVASLDGPVSRDGGFAFTYKSGGGSRSTSVAFTPPALVRWGFMGSMHLILYVLPTRIGWSRVFAATYGPAGAPPPRLPAGAKIPLAVRAMIWLTTRLTWLRHTVQSNPVFDGDNLLLHLAERRLYARGDHTSWRKQYFMPASADAGVAGWRSWIDSHGSELPTLPRGPGDLGPRLPAAQMFDRYKQHTKHCPSCSGALRNITGAMAVLAAASAVALGTALSAAVAGAAAPAAATAALAPAPAWPLAAGAAAAGLVMAAAAAALWRLRRLLIFYEYVHADH